MRFIPYNKTDLENEGWYRRTKNLRILEDFIDSGLDCAEIVEFTQKDASGCYRSLWASIKKFRFTSVKVIKRNNRVFLIKTL